MDPDSMPPDEAIACAAIERESRICSRWRPWLWRHKPLTLAPCRAPAGPPCPRHASPPPLALSSCRQRGRRDRPRSLRRP
jgi:hypothetical protein